MQSRNKIINKSTLCLFHTVCFTSHIVLGGTRGYCWMTPTEQAFSSLTSPQLPSPQTNLYRVYSLRIILYELKQTCDLIKYRNSIFPSFKVQSHYSVCNAYANFRKCMQISENFLYAQLLTPPLDYRPLQTHEQRMINVPSAY